MLGAGHRRRQPKLLVRATVVLQNSNLDLFRLWPSTTITTISASASASIFIVLASRLWSLASSSAPDSINDWNFDYFPPSPVPAPIHRPFLLSFSPISFPPTPRSNSYCRCCYSQQLSFSLLRPLLFLVTPYCFSRSSSNSPNLPAGAFSFLLFHLCFPRIRVVPRRMVMV